MTLLSLHPGQIMLAWVIVAAGAGVQGVVGFGFGLVAAPLLIHIDPRLAPGPIILGGMVATLMIGIREREQIDFRGVRWILVGRVVGTIFAVVTLRVIAREQMELALALVVLMAVVVSLLGLRLRLTRGNMMGAGTLSGFMATITSIGGPPLALLYQDASGAQLRGTLSGIFFIGSLISIIGLAVIGRFGFWELATILVFLPGIAVGFILSGWAARHLDRGYTRCGVLLVATVASLATVVVELT